MRIKGKIKKLTAGILAIIMLLLAMPITSAYASDEHSKAVQKLLYDMGKISEAWEDSKSEKKAGNWKIATERDRLPWNFFHNEVQKDIRDKNSLIAKQELEITYGDQNDKELRGKSGRADLYFKNDENGYTYIWEVKPYSYSTGEKLLKGMNQLAQYVASKPGEYTIGEDQIQSDVAYRSISVIHTGYTEHVTYSIYYDNMQNGIILYRFERQVDGREDNNEKVDEDKNGFIIKVPKKEEAVMEVLTPDSDYDDNIAAIDISKITALLTVSTAWGTYHDRINASPSTNNTLSAAISFECKQFQLAVAGVGAAFLVSPETVNAAEVNEAVNRFELAIDAYGGETILDELQSVLDSEDMETAETLLKEIQKESGNFDKAGKAQPPSDPLIIDFGKPGIELHSIENGVYFDLDNNGFAEKTAWIGSEDGFLAFDRNNNGVIDNGGELFGNQVSLGGGVKSSSGFEALAELDTNHDKIIDGNDSAFNLLKIWIDADHNGISEPEELKSLNDLGIISISLEYTENSFIDDETGARIADTAEVKIKRDGNIETVAISEFWFPVNSSDTTQGGTVTSGNVPDIISAVCEDESGELYSLWLKFSETDDAACKRYYLKKILYFITGANDVQPDSRGGNIDARDLRVIEQFMGRGFEGVGGAEPNTYAADILKNIYDKIENEYYNILNLYGEFGGYLNLVYEYENESGKKILELSFLQYLIDSKITHAENADTLVYDLGLYLKSYDDMNGTDYFSGYLSHYSEDFPQYEWITEIAQSCNTYLGTDADDSYTGTTDNDLIFGENGDDLIKGSYGDDVLYGGEGDDILHGEFGCDKMYGGTGNDVLYGGIEDDIYYFDLGDGEDVIDETGVDVNADMIVFGEGIDAKNVSLERVGNDLVLRYSNTDKVTVRDAYLSKKYSEYFVEYVRFADGTVWDVAKMTELANIRMGTPGNDKMTGYGEGTGYDWNEVFYAGAGNDTIEAGYGDDVLYGEDGDDILFGDAGRDKLYGGTGNDILRGGIDDDIYYFDLGDGEDIIEETGVDVNADMIVFGDRVDAKNVSLERIGNDLVIIYGKTDKVTIRDAYLSKKYSEYFVEYVRFADGTVWDVAKMTELAVNREGTAGDDVMTGYGSAIGYDEDEIFYAGAGNDTIEAGYGDDVLYGEDGDDILFGDVGRDKLYGGTGNDILRGGIDDDVYYFDLGDGEDIIEETGIDPNADEIVFGDGINAENVRFERDGNDLMLSYGEADSVTIKNAYLSKKYSEYSVEYVKFSDGTFGVIDYENVKINIAESILKE